MSYLSCPHCQSSNREVDKKCYSCGKSLRKAKSKKTAEQVEKVAYSGPADWPKFFVAVGLSLALGAGLGLAAEISELELPFFLEEMIIGVVCSLVAAIAIGKFQELPEHKLFPALGPAGLLGLFVGFFLFAVWWGLDPPGGLLVAGGIGGVCAAIPIAVSFGLLGGEVKGLGWREFANLVAGAILGLFLGGMVGDADMAIAFLGLGGLVPCLAAGRLDAATALMTIATADAGHERDFDDDYY